MIKLDAIHIKTIMALEEFFSFPCLDVLFLYFYLRVAPDCKSSFIAVQEEVNTAKRFWNCFYWPCSVAVVGSSWQQGTGFCFCVSHYSWWPRALYLFSYVSLSGICSTKEGWNSSYWHLLWTKGRKSKYLVIWAQVGFRRLPRILFQNQICIFFLVLTFFSSKREGDQWFWKRDLKKKQHHAINYNIYDIKRLSTYWAKTRKSLSGY